MSDKPILFQADMIRALLREIEQSGTGKTQTRRVMKPQPEFLQVYEYKGQRIYDGSLRVWCSAGKVHGRYPDEYLPSLAAMCPYGHPGDLLWSRETWARYNIDQDSYDIAYRATTPDDWPADGSWRPSIFMPRWASRLTLRITDVRVERVQDITAADALAEGLETWPHEDDVAYGFSGGAACGYATPTGAFHALWDSINAAPKPVKENGIITHYVSYPWEDIQETREHKGLPWYVYGNPWVWPISFDVIQKNIDQVLQEKAV